MLIFRRRRFRLDVSISLAMIVFYNKRQAYVGISTQDVEITTQDAKIRNLVIAGMSSHKKIPAQCLTMLGF